jgi:hypothetical protein
VRGYLKAMSPGFSNKTTAGEFIKNYPDLDSLVGAISTHDPNIGKRSLSSIRGNMRAAYDYLSLLQQSQQGRVTESEGTKRPAEETPSGEPTEKRQKKTPEDMVLPAALSRPIPNPGDAPVTPALDELASFRDMNMPLGSDEQKFKDQVMNTEQPVGTNTQMWKTNSLLDAATEARAIDLAEDDPIKPTKELEFIPDHVETALVSTQDEHYLEHRNANQLMHTTILPAAALTNNDGAGVREAIRRSDRDMEVEIEEQENMDKDPEELSKGGGSFGAAKGQGAKKVIPPEREMTIGQQLKGVLGNQARSITRALLGGLATGALRAAGIEGVRGNFPLSEEISKGIGGAVTSLAEYQDIRNKIIKQGGSEADVRKVLQELEETSGTTELEKNRGQPLREDDLRPFMPVAGVRDVELAPGDIEQKKRNVKLFNNYKPPNWPLGNVDNKLFFQNLVLQGIHWESPLDSLPQVLPGGSLLGPAQEFESDVYIPDNTTLRDMAVMKQVEFKMPYTHGQCLLKRMHKNLAAEARAQITIGDTKYIHNPRALGVDADLADGNWDFNPLDTPLHADLQVGGSRELRPLIPRCDADALLTQIGQADTLPPNEIYTTNPLFNAFGMYPRRF